MPGDIIFQRPKASHQTSSHETRDNVRKWTRNESHMNEVSGSPQRRADYSLTFTHAHAVLKAMVPPAPQSFVKADTLPCENVAGHDREIVKRDVSTPNCLGKR